MDRNFWIVLLHVSVHVFNQAFAIISLIFTERNSVAMVISLYQRALNLLVPTAE